MRTCFAVFAAVCVLAFSPFVLSGAKAGAAMSLNEEAVNVAHHLMYDQVGDTEINAIFSRSDAFVLAVTEAGIRELSIPEDVRQKLLTEAQQRVLNRHNERPILGGGCTQYLEEENGTNGRVYAYSYVTDQWCDGNDPDTDYRYNFNPLWAYNADNLRWYAKSGWVRYIFEVDFAGKLLGSSLCTSPIQLCIGYLGVWGAGGPGNVKQELWIWSK